MRTHYVPIFVVLVTVVQSGLASGQPTFVPLPAPVGSGYGLAQGVSADGTKVAGTCCDCAGYSYQYATQWSVCSGAVTGQALSDPYTQETFAEAISDDGTTVVGAVAFPDGFYIPSRWVNGTRQNLDLDPEGGNWGYGQGVSADGNVVVGMNGMMYGSYGFIWQNDVLSPIEGTFRATDVSGDGGIVIGMGGVWCNGFYWTPADGLMPIGTLPGGFNVDPWAISSDGTVIVGEAGTVDFYSHPFLYRFSTGQVQDLLAGGTGAGSAYGVSDRGEVVVGSMPGADGWPRATRWTATTGMRDLNELYDDAIPEGWVLREARDVSPDGRFMVGGGVNPDGQDEAWMLILPEDCDAADLDADGDVGVSDYQLLEECLGGPSGGTRSGCLTGDLDLDFDVDLEDFAALQRCAGGSSKDIHAR